MAHVPGKMGQWGNRLSVEGDLDQALAPHAEFFPQGASGLAVDCNQKIWAANQIASTAVRINPNAGPYSGPNNEYRVGEVDLTVDLREWWRHPTLRDAAPYSCSDMTGFVTLGATYRSGSWILVHDGGGPGKVWRKVAWNPVSQASGTGVAVEVRAAEKVTDLPWDPQSQVPRPFATIGNDALISGVIGRYLEVRVTLWKNVGIGQAPLLTDLTVRCPQ